MKSFEKNGHWWLPEAPDKRVAGTIRSNEDGELRLSLMGALGESGLRDLFESPDQPIILGVTDEKPGEQPVTLTDTFVTRQSLGSGGARRQEYFAHRAFWGAYFPSKQALQFKSVELSLSGLGAWAHQYTGFQPVPSGQIGAVAWKQPEAIRVRISDGVVLLGVGCSSSHTLRERTVRETLALTITLDQEKPLNQIEAELVSPIENFITFATDRPNALTEFGVSGSTTPSTVWGPVKVTGPRIYTDETVAAELRDHDLLFTLKDVEGRLDDVLQRWLTISRRYSGALAVYFGKLYDSPGYIDLRFQLLLQAVAVYYADSRGTDGPRSNQAGNNFDPLDPNVLLRTHPLAMAHNAVAGLVSEYGSVMAPIIGGETEAARATFTDKVVNNLDSILRRGNLPAGTPRDGAVLYWLGEQVAFLFKIALLAELGFSPADITTLLNRNRLFRHLRDHYKSLPG